MKNSIFKLMEKASREALDSRLEAYAAANGIRIGEGEGEVKHVDVLEQLNGAEEYLYAQFEGKNFAGEPLTNLPGLNMREALTSSDASILFPRVISNILIEPTEPALFLSNQVADTVTLAADSPLLIEFPTTDALQAFELAEGQEYTSQTLSFQQHMTSIRIKKIGLSAALSEEVITHSMWPLISLHLKMMKNAIDRKVESTLFQALNQRAVIVFDNNAEYLGNAFMNNEVYSKPGMYTSTMVGDTTDSPYMTTGKGLSAGTLFDNGSFSYFDLVKMCGVLLGNRYEASHFIAHPLAWPIFAQDPIIRAQFYHGGQLGSNVWNTMPQFDQQMNFPFGIQYVPYYACPFTEQTTLASGMLTTGASAVAANVTDVFLIDKNNSLLVATRGGTEMDQMDNWLRDAKMLKARKYVGITAKAAGRGMTVARNIRLVRNEEPIFTIRQVTT